MTWPEAQDMIRSFNLENFHFLRPKALYLFIPAVLIMLILVLGNKSRRKWKALVSPALRPYLFTRSSRAAILLPLILFAMITSCMIIGIAGPTWKKQDIPGEKINAVVLIALDLSKSMLADDLQPDRLQRAKYKIIDFLDANPRARVGLIAFAGTAHMVLPFTSDYSIIKQQVSSLENRSMPVQGSNFQVLTNLLDTTMQAIVAPSTVLVITDALASNDASLLADWINKTVDQLDILLMSAPAGAVIPGSGHLLSRQDPSVVANLSQDPKIKVLPVTLDRSDVAGIAAGVSEKLVFQEETTKNEHVWDDAGELLILPALLITLFWFRRGWVIQWGLAPLLLAHLSSCGLKSRHPDWWYSRDYQGQMLASAGKYEEAADRYADDQRKAIAWYKAGNFEAAADLFALDSSATGQYNRGLALTKLGRYADAEDAFRQAINLDPAMRDQAQALLGKVQAAKQRADSIARFDPLSVKKETRQVKDKKKGGKKDEEKERKPQSEDEQLSAETRVDKLPDSAGRVSDKALSNIHMGKESKQPEKNPQQGKEEQAATNILMKRAEADPAEFLKRRFELQVRRYYRHIPKNKDPW